MERSGGGRKSSRKLVAVHQDVALLPGQTVNAIYGRKVSLRYLVDGPKINVVVNGILLILAALDRDRIEKFAVQFYRLRIWVSARSE